MSLKILHTGDLHIGMKFNGYPEQLRESLSAARFAVLETLVRLANDEGCQLLVIAGDLFDKITVPVKDAERAAAVLDSFAGDCVLILPGNHDYDNGLGNLWKLFLQRPRGKTLILNEFKPYSLQEFDLDVMIYPAPCQRKHSKTNNLAWMSGVVRREAARWHIGIAHGALEGLSPDVNLEYYPLTRSELDALPVDLWLLGHTHLPYPSQEQCEGQKIFNAGTPEPDGLDCKHSGHAWLIELDESGKTRARLLNTGSYRFFDRVERVNDEAGFARIVKQYTSGQADRVILRLALAGVLEPQIQLKKEDYYRRLKESLAYFQVDDSELRVKITPEVIEREFTAGSFPQRFLQEFLQRGDQEALQLAYEMIREVKGL